MTNTTRLLATTSLACSGLLAAMPAAVSAQEAGAANDDRDLVVTATRREARTIHCSLAEDPAQCIIDTLHSIYCAADRPLRGAD